MEWLVSDEFSGERLRDAFFELTEFQLSRRKIQKLSAQSSLLLNGKAVSSDTKIFAGDIIWMDDADPGRPQYRADFEVLFEDEEILVINKPAGWVTSGNLFRTVENALESIKPIHDDQFDRPKPVHRLDAATSGILLFAKTKPAQQYLYDQFANQKIEKSYVAIVKGFAPKHAIINASLDRKRALTSFKTINRFASMRLGYISKLLVQIATGRTHQIRRHLKIAGHPVIGDAVYDPSNTYPGKGLFLHATSLRFLQSEGNRFQVDSPVPSKFASFCQREHRQWKKSIATKR